MRRVLKNTMAVVAIFAIAAIGFCAIEFAELAKQLRESTIPVLAHLDATVTDLNRTVLIAGGAVNEARKIERDNSKQIGQVNRETLRTLQSVNALLASVDASQKQTAASIQQTSAAILPMLDATTKDLRDLEPAIAQVTPLLQRSTDIAANLSNTTADVQHEIHKLVYPPPRKWYQKYFLDPLSIAAHLITIPLR